MSTAIITPSREDDNDSAMIDVFCPLSRLVVAELTTLSLNAPRGPATV